MHLFFSLLEATWVMYPFFLSIFLYFVSDTLLYAMPGIMLDVLDVPARTSMSLNNRYI